MSIVKLEIRLKEIPRALQAFKESRKKALDALTDEVREALSTGINQLLNAEIVVFLGQPDQGETMSLKGLAPLTFACQRIGEDVLKAQ